MRLRHIEIFYAVYTTGSISNAARLLNVAQPTVSQTLRHAEDQLGYNLFHRVRGRLIPTDEAQVLFADISEIYKSVVGLRKKARNLREKRSGRVRIAAVAALGLHALPLAVARFRENNPSVVFELQTRHYDNLLSALFSRDKDVGLALNPPQLAGISEIPFGHGELVCIYSKGEFNKHPKRIRLMDLEGTPFIGIDESGPLGELVSQRVTQEGVNLNSVITAQTYYVARNLVGSGAGVSVVDEFTARSAGIGNVAVKGFDPPLTFSIKALHLENKPPSKMCQNFLEYFQEHHAKSEFPPT